MTLMSELDFMTHVNCEKENIKQIKTIGNCGWWKIGKNKETSVLFYSFNSSLHNCPIKLNFNQLHLTYSYYEIFPLEWSLINVYNWNYCTWGFMFMIIWWKRRSISFDPLAWKISSSLQLPSSPCHHPYQRF